MNIDEHRYGELETDVPADHPEKNLYPVFIKTGYSCKMNPDNAEVVPPKAEIKPLL